MCQVPDYRKISTQDHAELVATLYKFIMGPEKRIPVDWFAKQVAFADRTDGDIDTLATRIAHIRTWTFVSNRADWLADPEHWQGRTREIEDSLSDALHEQLTQRFIDRRTSALMRGLKEKDELYAEIADDGAVHVEKHFVGRLQGFRFFPDTQGEGIHGRATRNAAAHVLAKELAMRARRVASAKNDAFKLNRRGQVLWRDDEIAQLEAGDDPLKPVVAVTADEHLSAPDKEKVKERLAAWIAEIVGERLKPLVEIAAAKDIAGLARGIAFRLSENFGALRREAVAEEMRALDQPARAQLRNYGVRFGAFNIYFPVLLKPASAELALVLWALKNGATHGIDMAAMPDPPRPGLTSLVADKAVPEAFYRVTGFHVCGPRAVRIDMLERLADQIRPLMAWRANPTNPNPPPKGATGDGGFRATPEMMSILGCSAGELGNVLQALGFRLDRVRIEPEPVKPAEAAPNGEPAVAPADTEATVGEQPAITGEQPQPPAQQPRHSPRTPHWQPARLPAPLPSSPQRTRRRRKSNGTKSGGLAVRDANPSSIGVAPTAASSRKAIRRRNPSPRGATGLRGATGQTGASAAAMVRRSAAMTGLAPPCSQPRRRPRAAWIPTRPLPPCGRSSLRWRNPVRIEGCDGQPRRRPACRDEAEFQRLDKWLWFARILKSRTLAAQLVTDGKVRINRTRATKPSHSPAQRRRPDDRGARQREDTQGLGSRPPPGPTAGGPAALRDRRGSPDRPGLSRCPSQT